MQYNVENLFMDLAKKGPVQDPLRMTEREWQNSNSSIYGAKPLKKVKDLAATIAHERPDVIGFCEVGGVVALSNFNQYFLDNQYDVYLIEGNSDRGIDVGYLVRKDLEYRAELKSHKEREFTTETGQKVFFSRDVAELRLFPLVKKDNDAFSAAGSEKLSQPHVVFLLVHLKSKWDREGDDPNGSYKREAEFRELLKVVDEIQVELGPGAPIVLLGDFNGQVFGDEAEMEFAEIKKHRLKDVFDLVQIDPEHRYTQIQIQSFSQSRRIQLDYIIVSEALEAKLVRAITVRYNDEFGMELPPPTSMSAKQELPSDHYPVLAEFKL